MSGRVLYLARHGATTHGEGRYIGDTDLPLNEAGRLQAERLGRFLADKSVTTIHCSDLRRGRDTAAIVALSVPAPVAVRADLREISMGAWEGLGHQDVATRFPRDYRERGEDMENYRIPGGETFAECARRARRAITEILAETSGNLLVVGHAGLNRTLLCHWTGLPLARMFQFHQDSGAVTIVGFDGAAAQVAVMNFHPEA